MKKKYNYPPPLTRSLSEPGDLRNLGNPEISKKELYFKHYILYLGDNPAEYSDTFLKLSNRNVREYSAGRHRSYWPFLTPLDEIKGLFGCFCLLRALEEGRNMTRSIQVTRADHLTGQALNDFLSKRYFYRVISTTKSENRAFSFAQQILVTLEIQSGIPAIDFTNWGFSFSQSAEDIAEKLKYRTSAINAIDNIKIDKYREIEVTLPPGFLENITCLVYRKNFDKSPFTYKTDEYNISAPMFTQPTFFNPIPYWLETVAIYENSMIQSNNNALIDFSLKEDHLLHFFGTYKPDYSLIKLKLKNKLRSFGSQDAILALLAPNSQQEKATSQILDEIFSKIEA